MKWLCKIGIHKWIVIYPTIFHIEKCKSRKEQKKLIYKETWIQQCKICRRVGYLRP